MAPKKKEGKDIILYSILTMYLMIGAATMLHDPILHGATALLFGFMVEDYNTGLGIGDTTALAPTGAPVFSKWVFFMLPAIIIFILVYLITIFKPNRLVFTAGNMVLGINVFSFHPGVEGSDAFKAMGYLIQGGWSEAGAYMLHLFILLLAFGLWFMHYYIIGENNLKDAKARMKNIIH